MDKEIFKAHWDEVKDSLKKKWAKLTDQDLAEVKEDANALSGILERQYGYAKGSTQKEVNAFLNKWMYGDNGNQVKNLSKMVCDKGAALQSKIKQHPFMAAGISLAVGAMLGRALIRK